MATTGHEHERVEVQGLKASLKKGGNIGIYNDCICSTASATAAKVTNTVPPSFTLTAKAKILVKFTYGINVANATLQVGENAAKPIFYQGSALDAGRVKAGMFVLMQYDGTNFNILGDIAKMDEYYKDLHAGLADNLFGETQTNDKFIFRPTAGIQDIESGEPPVGGGAIRKVEGNAVSWNQLVQNQNNSLTFEANVNGQKHIQNINIVINHKYLFRWRQSVSLTSVVRNTFVLSRNGTIDYEDSSDNHHLEKGSYSWIYTASQTISADVQYWCHTPNASVTIDNIQCIDLTLIFGSGNEPSTAEAFESWLSQNIGLKSYYPYNAGELIPVKDYKVKSVGFNQWDEEWETGSLDVDGTPISGTNQRSKNFIKILPSQTYYLYGAANDSIRYVLFDSNFKCVVPRSAPDNNSFTAPANAYYAKILYTSSVAPEEFCINLSYDDDKDGTYEPYEEHQVNIDVTKLYGKLNGSGDYVQVFSDGVKKAGTVADLVDLKNGVASKRVGSADLGTLNYTKAASGNPIYVSGSIIDIRETGNNPVGYNILSPKYMPSTSMTWDGLGDKEIGASSVQIRIYDSSYSDAATFKTAMSGVYFFYELATPLTYTDLIYRNNGVDIPVSEIKYAVDDYGTEEVLLGNDEEVVSCAPTMTIKYGINAADTVSSLPHTYVSSKYQSLNDVEQRTARANIGAASKNEVAVIRKQLEAIDKKVENDYYVDMGLPSGVLWAKRNIFTGTGNDMGFAPNEYSYDADYFSWGNTEGHIPSGGTFDYSFDETTYASTDGAKLTGNIPLSQDAARVNCGEPWRMPTKNEVVELLNYCDFIDASGNVIASTQANKEITMNSTVGIRLKSKVNGSILFIPCTGFGNATSLTNKTSQGYYLFNAPHAKEVASNAVRFLFIASSNVDTNAAWGESAGFTIRPVM